MADNPFARYAQQPETAANPFAQFAQSAATNEIPTTRRSYALSEVPGAALENAPASAGQFVGGVVQAITSPVQTLSGLLDLGAGALRNTLPKSVSNFIDKFDADPAAAERASAVASAVGGAYKDKYGSYDAIKRTFAEDPVGAVGDLSTLLTGGGAAATKAGAVKTGAALSRAGELTNVARPIAPLVEVPVKLAGKAAGAIYNAFDPKSIAYLTAAEGRGPEIVNALRGQTEIVPGSMPTAAQAASPVGATRFSSMGASAAKTTPTPYFERAQEQKAAQLAAVQQVGKTPAELAAAEAARAAMAKQLYGIADESLLPGRDRQFKTVQMGETAKGVPRIDPITGQAVMVNVQPSDVATRIAGAPNQKLIQVEVGRDSFNVPIYETRSVPFTEKGATQATTRDTLTNAPIVKQDVSIGGIPIVKQVLNGYKYEPELASLMERPAVQQAFQSAANIAANKGVSMFTEDGKLTGKGAHLVKLALDDAITPTPGTPIAKNTADAIKSAKSQYLGWVEENVPAYKTARETFAAQSKPINQMQVGQYLEGKLKPALETIGGESPAALKAGIFATAMEQAPQTIKRSTGISRFDQLSQVLEPDQIKVLENVRADLARAKLTEAQAAAARGAGPDVTLMGTETLGNVRAPNFINNVTTVANDILRRLQGKLDQKLAIELAAEMLDPAAAAAALEKAMAREARGQKLSDPFKKAGKAASTIIRTPAAINAMAPISETQNAFVGQ